MSAIELPHVRRLAFGVVLGQAGITVIAALAAWVLGGPAASSARMAGVSALVGGGIATIASLVMVAVALTGKAASAARALSALYVGEAVKLAVVVTLLVWVLRSMKVAPLAMFAAFGATLLVYWVALLCAVPRLAVTAPSE